MKNKLFTKRLLTTAIFDQSKIRSLLFAFGLCFISSFSFLNAQVSGTLIGEDGDPLIGVNVLVKGTDLGTITDIDGNYSINAKDGDVLIYSYVGFQDQEVVVGSGNSYSITMSSNSELLDEIVVVGYGSRKKSDITGAVSSVTTDELTAFPVLDAGQALQGRAAGVVVQSNNCLLYTSPSPRDRQKSRMPSSA